MYVFEFLKKNKNNIWYGHSNREEGGSVREPGLARTCHKVFPCNFPFPWMKELRPRARTTPALPTQSLTHSLVRSLARTALLDCRMKYMQEHWIPSPPPPPPPVHDTPSVFVFFVFIYLSQRVDFRLCLFSPLFQIANGGEGFGVLTCTALVQVTGIWNPNV